MNGSVIEDVVDDDEETETAGDAGPSGQYCKRKSDNRSELSPRSSKAGPRCCGDRFDTSARPSEGHRASGTIIGGVVEPTTCGESPCNAVVMSSSPAPALGSRSMSMECIADG